MDMLMNEKSPYDCFEYMNINQYVIEFFDREQFNKVLDWINKINEPCKIDDIGYSDMMIIFPDIENAIDCESCMIINHIKTNQYKIYKRP